MTWRFPGQPGGQMGLGGQLGMGGQLGGQLDGQARGQEQLLPAHCQCPLLAKHSEVSSEEQIK